MILLTKLNGDVFALNPSFITRIEQHKDTIVFTRDGNDVMVLETLQEIIDQLHTSKVNVLSEAMSTAAGLGAIELGGDDQ